MRGSPEGAEPRTVPVAISLVYVITLAKRMPSRLGTLPPRTATSYSLLIMAFLATFCAIHACISVISVREPHDQHRSGPSTVAVFGGRRGTQPNVGRADAKAENRACVSRRCELGDAAQVRRGPPRPADPRRPARPGNRRANR